MSDREEFEKWAKNSGYALLKTGLNQYFYGDTGAAWDVWQAAHASESGEAVAAVNKAATGEYEFFPASGLVDMPNGIHRLYANPSASLPDNGKPVACVTDLGLGSDRVVQWYVDPLPDGTLLYAYPVPELTAAKADAGCWKIAAEGAKAENEALRGRVAEYMESLDAYIRENEHLRQQAAEKGGDDEQEK